MFLSFPLIRILPYTDGWETATECAYEVKGKKINIDVGFVTDFASIPAIFQSLIKVNGKHRLAALMHDHLYSKKGTFDNIRLTRKECDEEFLKTMKEHKVKYVKRYAMFYAVRKFGATYWDE